MYSAEVQPYLDIYYNTLDKSKIRELIQYSTDGGKCVRGFIVKHIIEAHGETINVRSATGDDSGTTFSFTLKKAH